MSFKAKTVLNKDIRIFKQDIDNMEQAFETIKSFIKEKYGIEGSFIIQYEDDEKDLITISSSDDLQDAYSQAEESGNVLKIIVVPENKNGPVYSFTSELDKSALNGEGKNNKENSSSDEEEVEEEEKEKNEDETCIGKQLLNDLINNKEFREEFINFITDFIKRLQENIINISNETFQQSLLNHQKIGQHPAIQKFADLFPVLLNQFQPFLSFIGGIDVENVAGLINGIIEMYGNFNGFNNGFNNFGPFMNMFNMFNPNGFGLFGHSPPQAQHHGFGGCHGFTPFGPPPSHCPRSYFHHGHGHGHGHGPAHHPPFHGFYGRPFGCKSFCQGNRCGKNEEKMKKCHQKFSGCGNKWQKYYNRRFEESDQDYSVKIIKDDVTLQDKAYVLPGQVVVKTWRIKNDGKKDWPTGMKIKYNGKAFNPIISGVEYDVPNLKINEEAEISVISEIPKLQDNIYEKQKSNWRIYLPNGHYFGPLFRIRVFIVNENEATTSTKKEDIIPIQDDNEEKKNENENENNNNNKEEKQKEKLLKAKNKLEKKVAKLDAKINKDKNEQILNDDKEMIQDQSSSFSEVEAPPVVEEFDMDIDDQPQPEPQPQPLVESNINHVPYPYEKELDILIGMGFNDLEKIRQLLIENKGNVNAVINQLF